ncbi:MAG TPA: hypothetical protein VGB69_10140 [Edaphobacter sp.]
MAGSLTQPRTLPLFDPEAELSSWNERMVPGEYAVHYSSFAPGETPFCTVFDNLPEAEAYAKQQVAEHPELLCNIYDHNGRVGKPVREIRGSRFKDTEITPRFRRWVGSILFFGGLILTAVDWSVDFRYLWPSMLGTRMMMPGLALLVMEVIIVLYARHARQQQRAA